jgi:hypothetical protein
MAARGISTAPTGYCSPVWHVEPQRCHLVRDLSLGVADHRAGSDRRQDRPRLWLELLLVVGASQAYELVRLLTTGSRTTALRHGEEILAVEQRLGLRWEDALQHIVLRHHTLVSLCNTLYTWGFWPIVTGALLVLYIRRPTLHCRYRNAIFISGAIGLAIFASYPTAPPRMLTASSTR